MLRDRKTQIIVGGLFIAILIVVSLGYAYRSQLANMFGGDKANDGERNEIQLQELAGEIIKGKNFDDCKKIDDAYYEAVCMNNIALEVAYEQLDVQYCQKMDNALVPIAECERRVVLQKSIKQENVVICDEATDQNVRVQCRESFLFSLALAKNSIAICTQGETVQQKNDCSNTYLFQKEFIANPRAFDCSRFVGVDMQGDCKTFTKPASVAGFGACDGLHSELFIQYCMVKNLRR